MLVVVRRYAADTALAPPAPDEVHVWVLDLASPPHPADHLLARLTPDEAGRAARYRAPRVREQFVTARGLLRGVLGGYLGVDPRDVPITYLGSGKPVLEAGPHFNLTHTDGLGLVAVAGRRVGIDVERIRGVENADGLVGRFFSGPERAAFAGLAEAHREAAFFRGWACKEAVIKAVGASVQSLECFDVEMDPARPPGVCGLRHPEMAARPWALAAWAPAPGFQAAVAVEADGPLRVREG